MSDTFVEMSSFAGRLRALTPATLKQIRRGIEKESLRVRPDGKLALTPHPAALGSPLTHPHITTDFSESQLELITGVHTTVDACLGELARIHQFVYKSIGDAQAALCVSYNDLDHYAASLDAALSRPFPAYEKIGIREKDEYRQLSTSLLQIENEFYSTVRPKRRIRPGERPLHALRERGVEYVEVRAMDLDPFSAVGITADTVRFLDVFLLHCLLSDSPPDSRPEVEAIGRNKLRAAA